MHHSMLMHNYARTKACLYVYMLMNACLCIYWKHVYASHEYSWIRCMYKHALNVSYMHAQDVCICMHWMHISALTENISMHALSVCICTDWLHFNALTESMPMHALTACLIHCREQFWLNGTQGTLTVGEGSVRLTTSFG